VLVEVHCRLAAQLRLALPLRFALPVDDPALGRTRLLATTGGAPAGSSEINDLTHVSVSSVTGKNLADAGKPAPLSFAIPTATRGLPKATRGFAGTKLRSALN
jgi:hypothetical protein